MPNTGVHMQNNFRVQIMASKFSTILVGLYAWESTKSPELLHFTQTQDCAKCVIIDRPMVVRSSISKSSDMEI